MSSHYQKKKILKLSFRKATSEDVTPMAPHECVRKWEKKWTSIGHMKVLKWEPIVPRFKPIGYHKEIQLQKKFQQIQSQISNTKSGPERKNLENAPITRSVSAVYGGISHDSQSIQAPRRRSTRISNQVPHNDVDPFSPSNFSPDDPYDENY